MPTALPPLDRVWVNAHLATMEPRDGDSLGVIADGAIAAKDGRIAWVGRRADLPAAAVEQVDCGGAWILPGLIDCHTHLVFAGDRADEFERRLAGATYREIAEAGGGILSTMRATRAADEAALLAAARPRLAALMAEGVTTVEIKSGYGLERES
jgi:imidazolonepropionase